MTPEEEARRQAQEGRARLTAERTTPVAGLEALHPITLVVLGMARALLIHRTCDPALIRVESFQPTSGSSPAPSGGVGGGWDSDLDLDSDWILAASCGDSRRIAAPHRRLQEVEGSRVLSRIAVVAAQLEVAQGGLAPPRHRDDVVIDEIL